MPYSPTGAGIAQGLASGADRFQQALAILEQMRQQKAEEADTRAYRDEQLGFQKRTEDRQVAADARTVANDRFEVEEGLRERGGGFGAAPRLEPPVDVMSGARIGRARDATGPSPLAMGGPQEPELRLPRIRPPLASAEPQLAPRQTDGLVRPPVAQPQTPDLSYQPGRRIFESVQTPHGPGFVENAEVRAARLQRESGAAGDREILPHERAQPTFAADTDADWQRRKTEMDYNVELGYSPTGARLDTTMGGDSGSSMLDYDRAYNIVRDMYPQQRFDQYGPVPGTESPTQEQMQRMARELLDTGRFTPLEQFEEQTQVPQTGLGKLMPGSTKPGPMRRGWRDPVGTLAPPAPAGGAPATPPLSSSGRSTGVAPAAEPGAKRSISADQAQYLQEVQGLSPSEIARRYNVIR